MAITSGFFNSVNGDRKYNAEQMSMYFDKLITSGVYPNPSTNLQVIATSGMTVNVLPGRGIIDCRWLNNDANEPLTLEASDVLLNRIDAVVMVLDLNESVRNCHIRIKKGAPATTPSAPTMERSEYVKEYCLAQIYVGALVEEITQVDITDTRANTNICGWVTGLIEQVDTATLFLQWQTAYANYYDKTTHDFDVWFANIRDTLTTSAVIKRFVSSYVTETEGEKNIVIGVANFNAGIDLLNVYINGLRLIEANEYTINPDNTITLALGVIKGTPILFEVYKVVDSDDVWSAVAMLEDAQPIVYKDVTIAVSDWVKGSVYYEATITNERIDSNTFVNINFAVNSLAVVVDAGVLNVAESIEGAVKLYSTSIPSTDVICDYTVQKGRVVE